MKIPLKFFKRPSFIQNFQDYECFKGKHIGLTGHRGILGSILYSKLKEYGIKVTPYPNDINNHHDLIEWFSQYQFTHFLHFAAIVAIDKVEKDIFKAYETNVIGTYNICKQIVKTQSNCWFFFASSSHVYKPTKINNSRKLSIDSPKTTKSIYGQTKLASEKLIELIFKTYASAACIGRIFSFTSPAQKEPFLVPAIIRAIEKTPNNAKLEVKNADSIRDIMPAEAVIDCILFLAKNNFSGTLNIGSGKGKSVFKIAQEIVKLSNKNIKIDICNTNTPNAYIANVKDLKKILLR